MKKSKKDLLRRATIARKSKRLVTRPGFAPQDLPDAIEIKLAEGLLHQDLSEAEAYEIALDNHPDLKAMERAGMLPEKLLDQHEGPWSPRLHLELHAVVERQLATDQPKGIVELAIQFEREKKLCAHEVKHVIVAALTEQIWNMQHEHLPFNEEQYFIDVGAAYQRWCKAYENGADEEDN
jgi:hypothetical protein